MKLCFMAIRPIKLQIHKVNIYNWIVNLLINFTNFWHPLIHSLKVLHPKSICRAVKCSARLQA